MADFFKYVGKADRGIQDWSKIGKDISDDLKKVTDDRQAKRAKIDKLTSDAVNEVNNVQLGQNKTFNQFLLNGSGQTKEFLLMQEKLLKQGVLKPQDYLNSRQIVSDDWANLSEAAKSFNTDYAESMSRLQDGKAAMQELYQNEKYDAFMNVQDKDVFINPVDGRMYLTTTDGDGNIERDPASMLNVNSINARRKDKINKFNVQAEVQKATGALGEVVKALNADGVITRDDKRLNEYSMLIDGVEMTFADAKNDIIDSLMTSPRNNASILTDDVGGYTFTEVESEAGGKVIYLKENGMGLLEPQLTDEQLGVVRNNLDMEIEKQLGFKETSSYEADLRKKIADADLRERKAARIAKEEDFSDVYSYAVDLASGDSTGVRRVVQSLKQTHPHLSFTPSEGDTPGWDVYNSKTGVEDTIEIVDGDVAGFSDALFNVIVGDQGVKGIQITSKAKDQYLKGNTLPTDVVKATSGSTRKKLSVISGGGIPSTGVEDDKGKPITISDAINEKGEKKGYKLETRSDFEKAVHTMQLPAEYKAIQNKIPKEFRFREVDGDIMMYYPGPGEERYQANLGEKDIRNDMLKYINEGLKNLIQNENARIDKINDRAMGKKEEPKKEGNKDRSIYNKDKDKN